jgi:transposase InsO family protein
MTAQMHSSDELKCTAHAVSITLYARSQSPTNLAWLLDSGASIHLVNNLQYLHNAVVYQSPRPLHLATSDAVGGIIAKGSVCLLDARGSQLWLHDVQCVPAATTNLISVSAAIKDGCQFRTDSRGAHVQMIGPETWACAVAMSKGLYYLQRVQCRTLAVPRAASLPESAEGPVKLPHNCQLRDLWHRRLGHPGETAMSRITREGLISGLPVSLIPCADCSPACEACLQGKLPRPPFPNSTRPASRVLERIHLDTVGELPVRALTGEKYWVTVLDEASHCVAAIPVKSKAEIPRKLKELLMYWQRRLKLQIKFIRSDRGTEFINQEFRSFCLAQGIEMETSAPGTPQQNGAAERMNRTLKERVRTLLAAAQAKQSLWKEALQAAVILCNIVPASNRSVTPYEAFLGIKPTAGALRTWGCKAFVLLQKPHMTATGPRALPGMMVGYELGSKAYRILTAQGIKVSRDVRFIEEELGAPAVGYLDLHTWGRHQAQPPPGPTAQCNQSPASRSAPTVGAPAGPRPLDLLQTRVPAHLGAGPSPGPSGATNGTPGPAAQGNQSPASRSTPAVEAPAGPRPLDPLQAQVPAHLGAGPPPGPSGSTNEAPGPSADTNDQLQQAQDLCATPQHSMPGPEPRSPSPAQSMGSPGTDAEVPAQPGRRSWSLIDRARAIARGREVLVGQAVPLQATQKLLRPPSGIPVAGEAQRAAVQAQQRRERADRRNLVRELQSRMQVFPSATPSERITECLSRGCSSSPKAISHGPRGIVSHERDIEEAGEVDSPREYLKTGTMGPSAIPDSKVQQSAQHKVQRDVPAEYSPHHSSPSEREFVETSETIPLATECACESVEIERGTEAQMGPESEMPASQVPQDPSARLSTAKCESRKECKTQVSATEHSVRMCGEEAERDGYTEERFYVFRCEERLPNEGEPGVKFSKITVPRNYREARQSDQWSYWEQAMNEEKNSLDAHETMEYVERPWGKKVIPVHWIYSAKVDNFGNVLRFKARLVAQGCRQIPGVDVDEVFAPTSSFAARRVILSVAAQRDYEIHQVDIKTAFLNGDLEEEVYVTQPPGFENGDPRVVCKLNKALYGLKQSPRAWHKRLDAEMSALGFVACKSDAGVYVRKKAGEKPLFILVYVDDLLIICKDLSLVEWFKELLKSKFTIHDLGEVKDFLGCQVRRNRQDRQVSISCIPKIEALLEKFGVSDGGRVVDTPMHKGFVPTQMPYVEDERDGSGAGVPLDPGHRYCELIGSLLYIANTTRPDIAQAVGVLSRYRCNPTTAHWNAAMRVLHYLRDTKDKVLVLGGNSSVVLEGYVDADFAGDLDSRFSTSGYVFYVCGGAVSWASKKQNSVATSTVEAEFMASSLAIKEANWLRSFLEEIGEPPWSVKIYVDNQGCINHLRNPVNSKFTKHIAVAFHFAREAIKLCQVDVQYVESAKNRADVMTKPLVGPVFRKHVDALGLLTLYQE